MKSTINPLKLPTYSLIAIAPESNIDCTIGGNERRTRTIADAEQTKKRAQTKKDYKFVLAATDELYYHLNTPTF